MRIVDFNRGQYNWQSLGITRSNSANWAFDRLRLYTPTNNTKVALWSLNDFFNDPNKLKPTYGIQQFHSGGGWTTNELEHDFEFDLSDNVNNDLIVICISGVPDNAKWQQIYAWPTGFSATRGKNAGLYSWNFNVANPPLEVSGVTTTLYMNSQNPPLRTLDFGDSIFAKTIRLDNNDYSDYIEFDNFLIAIDTGGQVNGVLNYNNIGVTPSNASRAAYDSLIAKGWTITGTPPPTS